MCGPKWIENGENEEKKIIFLLSDKGWNKTLDIKRKIKMRLKLKEIEFGSEREDWN